MNRAAHSNKFPLTDEDLVEMISLDHEWALKEIFLKRPLEQKASFGNPVAFRLSV